ncbi:MAG: S9 family peptidase [Myxococcota bacterium]
MRFNNPPSVALAAWLLPALSGCRPAEQPAIPPTESTPRDEVSPKPFDVAKTEPSTAPPADAGPTIAASSYDPGADPRNATGWDFTGQRDPGDASDAAKAPFTIEALYRLAAVGRPEFSPDGRRLVFTTTSYDLTKGKSNTDIWRVDVDGTNLRRLTHHEARDADPHWFPDGKSILFVSTRGGKSQLWRMAVDGGEAEALTSISTGVSSPAISPDGTKVGFVSHVFPKHGANDEANAGAIEDADEDPLVVYMADDLLYRHWTSWSDGRRDHILVLDLADETIIDVTPGDFESPAFGDETFVWSPDSSEICFVSNREPQSAQSWTTNKDLFVVPASGGKVVNLTPKNRAYDGSPQYSPDGRTIAFRRQTKPGYESDRFRLAVYDRKTGRTQVVTEAFDNWVEHYEWAPDGKSLLFSAPVEGRTPVFRVPVDGGAITKLGLPSVRSFSVGSSGAMAFTFSRVGQPVELFVADAAGASAKRITGFNDAVRDAYDLRPTEEMWVEGADGKKVHVFVVKPHGFSKGKRYPLIINVHGGPQYQWSDYLRGDWQVYPAAGYVVAFFNPHGSSGYGQAYTEAISGDWGGRVFEDVMAVTDALVAEPYVDPKRVGAMGWSYGGYMMNWLLGHTDRFAAIASMMGIYDLPSFYGATEELWFPEWDLKGAPWDNEAEYRKWSPSTYAAKFSTPTLVVTGERDYRVPYTQSLQLFTALRRRDVPARLLVFPNDGHWPSFVKSMPMYYAAHLDWFHRWLGGDAAPQSLTDILAGQARWDDELPAKTGKRRGRRQRTKPLPR